MATDAKNQKPVKTFRSGAVGASIWLRHGEAGSFFDVTFSRSWKSAETGKAGYAQNFCELHLEALSAVALDARAWIANARQIKDA